jgi:hypothetical protein
VLQDEHIMASIMPLRDFATPRKYDALAITPCPKIAAACKQSVPARSARTTRRPSF